jgi:hypothetical protein
MTTTGLLEYKISRNGEAAGFRCEMAKHFSHWNDPDAYAWEWENCPFGSTQCIVCHNNQVIGHYGLIGINFLLENEHVAGAKIEGSYLKYEYSGRRAGELFPELSKMRIFRSLVSFGIEEGKKQHKFIFGFPNPPASRPQVVAGCGLWNVSIRTYSLAFHPKLQSIIRRVYQFNPILSRVFIVMRGSGMMCSREEMSEDVLSAVAEINSACGLNTIDYDPFYLRWRVLLNPHSRGFVYIDTELTPPGGFLIGSVRQLEHGLRILTINDLKLGPSAEGRAEDILLRLVRRAIEEHRPDAIHTWFNRNHLETVRDAALRVLGFQVSHEILPVLFVSDKVPLSPEEFDINPMWTEGV